MTKLDCGWEEECKAKSCLKCPRKYKISIEITEAEANCIEDIGVCDIQAYLNEHPKEFDLLQDVMRKLMVKVFTEIDPEDETKKD